MDLPHRCSSISAWWPQVGSVLQGTLRKLTLEKSTHELCWNSVQKASSYSNMYSRTAKPCVFKPVGSVPNHETRNQRAWLCRSGDSNILKLPELRGPKNFWPAIDLRKAPSVSHRHMTKSSLIFFFEIQEISWGRANLESRLFSSFRKLNAGFFNIHVF